MAGKRRAMAPAVAACALLLGACGGGGDTTTVIREAPPEGFEQPTRTQAPRKPTAEPPNVRGLPLPAAYRQLRLAGYKAIPKNTDTTFGIIVPENYTICEQGEPRGELVIVLAQKYGC